MQGHRNFSSASTLFTLALAFLASPVNSLAGGAPPPNISPLTIEGASPTIWFDDTQDEDATPSWDWAIQTDGGTANTGEDSANTFQILDYDEDCVLIEKAPDTPNEVIEDPCPIPVVTIESNGDGATADAIKVFGNGDVVLGGEDGLSVGAGSAFILAPDEAFPEGDYPPYLAQWTPGTHLLFSPSPLALQAIYAFDTSVNPELESPIAAGSAWYAAGAGQTPLGVGSSVGLFDIVANTFPFTMETGTSPISNSS